MSVNDQASDFIAPALGKIIAIAVDSTSRVYDLSTIDLGTPGAAVGGGTVASIFVTLLADGNDVYWALSATNAGSISDTAGVTAGGTPTLGATVPWRCPKDAEQSRRFDRNAMRYLYLKTASGTATARLMATSSTSGNASSGTPYPS